MTEQFIDESILEVFLFESSQLLAQLETSILTCEETNAYSLDMINDIFRIMHTIKGSSSMMSFHNIAALSHALEDLFALLRKEQPVLSDYTKLSDLMLEGIDFMKIELEKIKNGDPADGDAKQLIEQARQFLQELTHVCKTAAAPGDVQLSPHVLPADYASAAVIWLEDCGGMEQVRAFQIIRQLQEQLDISYEPGDLGENEAVTDRIRQQGFLIMFKDQRPQSELDELLRSMSYIRQIDWLKEEAAPPVAAPSKTAGSNEAAKGAAGEKGRSAGVPSSFISVNVTKLDELMDLVGELVIAEAMVTQNPDLRGLELEQFVKAARHLKKITDEIQDKVMSVRMVPLTNTFQKMHRIVRDMSKKLDKDVHLQLIGEDTEVDKNIIEHISDPLMHIVRNSIDHGLEYGEERKAKGKPAAGTITLEAKNAGNEVFVFIRDDGRGLNREKLLKRARENHLLHKPESELTDREIYNLIFLPGFSTKEKITEFSGRGVGMDVVTKNIGAVGGTVTVDSVSDAGTTITIRIPLTLAIIDGMNVKVGQSRYTLPTTVIQESFRPARNDIIIDPAGNEMIMVRGRCYPIVRLHARYDIATEVTQIEDGILIMVQQDKQQMCLFADELIGQQQVVVKSLPAYIKQISNIKGITGCTLLGDGSISLILDISSLTSI